MLKILLLATLFIFSITTFPTQTEANSDYPKRPAITIINPLRGHQLGLEGADLLASLKEQWLLTNNLNANATWLWQYSALEEKEMVDFAKKEMRNQEFGIFLEIDKNFAEKSDIRYKGHGPWYFSDGLLDLSRNNSGHFLL